MITGEQRGIPLTPDRGIDFGDVTQDSATTDISVVLSNASPFNVLVSNIRSLNPVFRVRATTPPLPTKVAPNQSLLVSLYCNASSLGEILSALVVEYDDPCVVADSIKMNCTSFAGIKLALPVIAGRIDDELLIPVIVSSGGISEAGDVSWHGAVRFNPAMLYPLEVVSAGSLSRQMAVTMHYDTANGTVFVDASGSTVSGTGALVYIRCKVLLGDALQTNLDILQETDFTSGFARVISRTSGLFTLIEYCDERGRRLLQPAQGFRLLQNIPNPFNPVTKIAFSIDKAGYTTLVVYDAVGRLVKTLSASELTPGRHEVLFDASGISSGVYRYVLRSGTNSASRTMVVVK